MSDGDVHPPIFVVVEHGNAHSGRELVIFIQGLGGIFAFARIDVEKRRGAVAGDDQVDSTVVVEVGEYCTGGDSGATETGWFGPLGEGLVPIVPP